MLYVACCALFGVYTVAYGVCRALCDVCCVLCDVCCVLYVACGVVCNASYALYGVWCVMNVCVVVRAVCVDGCVSCAV